MASLLSSVTGRTKNKQKEIVNMRFKCKVWSTAGKMQVDEIDAPNRDALKSLYATLGQKIEIIGEIGQPQGIPEFEDGNKSANKILNSQGGENMVDGPAPDELPPVDGTGGISQQTIVPFKAPPKKEEQIPVPVFNKPMYFEDAGIKFKVDRGIVSKKVWVELSDKEKDDYRIEKTEDGDMHIMKLDWLKITEEKK